MIDCSKMDLNNFHLFQPCAFGGNQATIQNCLTFFALQVQILKASTINSQMNIN